MLKNESEHLTPSKRCGINFLSTTSFYIRNYHSKSVNWVLIVQVFSSQYQSSHRLNTFSKNSITKCKTNNHRARQIHKKKSVERIRLAYLATFCLSSLIPQMHGKTCQSFYFPDRKDYNL